MEEKIKVLHIGLSSNVGGVEMVVHSWIKFLPKWLIFDFINVENKQIAFEKDFLETGSKIYNIPSRKTNPYQYYIQLKNIIKENNYEFVQHHVMSLSCPEPVLITNRYSNAKAIIHSHTVINNNLALKYKILHQIGKIRLKHSSYLCLACGKEAGKNMFEHNKFTVIENGIDINECKYSLKQRVQIRKQYNIKENTFLIGHVGRACYEKNYPFLIDCFKEILKVKENVKLMLIGNVDKDDFIQGLIKKYQLEKNVICTGYVNNPRAYYSAMDVFFFPSLFEGLSVSLVEAQASGLPCVVSENVARESAISDFVTFIPIDNCKKAVEEILKVAGEKRERSERKISEKYNIVNSSKKMFEFYKANR